RRCTSRGSTRCASSSSTPGGSRSDAGADPSGPLRRAKHGSGVMRHGIAWPTVATALLLAGGAAYLLAISPAIPEQARLYPQIFLLALLGGGILLALQTLAQGWRARAGDAAPAPAAADLDRPGWPLYPALVVYVLVLNRLGF